ncbi:MAG TPA: hypothetical protein VGF94_30525 [Kofleriaceae bacterium]
MTPRVTVQPKQLAAVRPWEYALRFVFGGAITVGAWLVGKHWGTAAGGLFLAFPAIMPASLTLVKHHDGRQCAIDDARGGRIATVALACFALIVATTATRWPPVLVLAVAALAWMAVAAGSWFILACGERHAGAGGADRRRRGRPTDRARARRGGAARSRR